MRLLLHACKPNQVLPPVLLDPCPPNAPTLARLQAQVLYTVVTREEKYKAKLSIDSVVQRLGDTVAAALFEVLGGCCG